MQSELFENEVWLWTAPDQRSTNVRAARMPKAKSLGHWECFASVLVVCHSYKTNVCWTLDCSTPALTSLSKCVILYFWMLSYMRLMAKKIKKKTLIGPGAKYFFLILCCNPLYESYICIWKRLYFTCSEKIIVAHASSWWLLKYSPLNLKLRGLRPGETMWFILGENLRSSIKISLDTLSVWRVLMKHGQKTMMIWCVLTELLHLRIQKSSYISVFREFYTAVTL